jgi:hypothetical protein
MALGLYLLVFVLKVVVFLTGLITVALSVSVSLAG